MVFPTVQACPRRLRPRREALPSPRAEPEQDLAYIIFGVPLSRHDLPAKYTPGVLRHVPSHSAQHRGSASAAPACRVPDAAPFRCGSDGPHQIRVAVVADAPRAGRIDDDAHTTVRDRVSQLTWRRRRRNGAPEHPVPAFLRRAHHLHPGTPLSPARRTPAKRAAPRRQSTPTPAQLRHTNPDMRRVVCFLLSAVGGAAYPQHGRADPCLDRRRCPPRRARRGCRDLLP